MAKQTIRLQVDMTLDYPTDSAQLEVVAAQMAEQMDPARWAALVALATAVCREDLRPDLLAGGWE
jgi:hypothetical protein